MFRFFAYIVSIGTILLLTGVGGFALYVAYLYPQLPDHETLRNYSPPIMTRVHADDGTLIAEYSRERRLFLPIEAIPQKVINGFVAAEDQRFYSHPGFDVMGIGRAAVAYIQNYGTGRRPQGASTITQQVARNFLLSNELSVLRKLKEILLAVKIEQSLGKDKVMELYLNEIFFGLGAYGLAAASQTYFSKSVHQLELHEIAYLAALPRSSSNYHPFRHPQAALERRNWVIDRMVEEKFVSLEEAKAAKDMPLSVNYRPSGVIANVAGYYVEDVRRELASRYGEEKLYGGGLTVRTALNLQLQDYANKALVSGLVSFDRKLGWRGPVTRIDGSLENWSEFLKGVETFTDIPTWLPAVVLQVDKKEAKLGVNRPDGSGSPSSVVPRGVTLSLENMSWARAPKTTKKPTAATQVLKVGDVVYVSPTDDNKAWQLQQVPTIEAGMVVMDPKTGRVLALAGGFSFSKSQFNRATQALRQPGSAFKPIVYAAALENGYTPASIVLDSPIEVENQGPGRDIWRPENYSKEYYGPSTLRLGIERSRNLMTVRLAQDLGMPTVVDFAKRVGAYDDLSPLLAMSLGAGETTVLKMSRAYSAFANGGYRVEPTLIDRVQDRYGRNVYSHDVYSCNNCSFLRWDNQPEPELVDLRPRVMESSTAYQTVSMLEGVVQRGTGTAVKVLKKPLAGKTGTSNDEKDAWFVGFSPDLVAGVYVGYDEPKSMGRGGTGGQVAAPIFRDFMAMALKDKPSVPFPVPQSIEFVRINPRTGQYSAGGEGSFVEAFRLGTGPGDNLAYGNEDGQPTGNREITSGTGGLY